MVTKAALVRWSTARFYRWNAALSLLMALTAVLAVALLRERPDACGWAGVACGTPLVTSIALVAAALPTVGCLSALATGPASVVVPLVATSPVLGGLLGILILRGHTTRRQRAGIGAGLAAFLLLARPG